MKYIKLLIIVAILGVLSSCTERQFEPTLGDTKVEFVEAEMTAELTGQYYYIPVRMVKQSSTGAKAVISYIDGKIEMKDGTKKDAEEFTNDKYGYENGGDFIITSNEIFIGPYNEDEDGETGDPTNSFEVRIPNYNKVKSMVLNFELVGNNVGDNSTLTYTIQASTDPLSGVTGTWSWNSENSAGETAPLAFTISKNPLSGAYTLKYADGIEFAATGDKNTLIVDLEGPKGIEVGLGTPVDLIICAVEDGALDPSENSVLTYDEAKGKLTATNGMFFGFNWAGSEELPAGYYHLNAVNAGTVGSKK